MDDTIREYVRGIRAHFPKLVKIVSGGVTDRAQLGLGHSYSRCKVKFNVNRSDNMIIQAIALLDQLDKDLNTFAMRVKEWYSWHFPEMSVLVKDNYLYSRAAQVIQSRTKFLKDEAEGRKKLTEILMDDDVVDKVVAAMRTSMGMDVSEIDMLNIKTFAARVVSLSKYRKGLQDYLTERMTAVAPNLQALIGDVVGARLISHAGSLTNLAKAPASTVQILGAEKALFRALKTRGNTPKYGLIYHSTFIGRAGTKNKGRISRYLANKCSIASRIDAFSDQATAKVSFLSLSLSLSSSLFFECYSSDPQRCEGPKPSAIRRVSAKGFLPLRTLLSLVRARPHRVSSVCNPPNRKRGQRNIGG